jgi:hypothetical protein
MKYGIVKRSVLAAACIAAALASSPATHALEGDLSSMFPVNDIDPKTSIPTDAQREANPIEFGYWLQDMIVRAEKGVETKDWNAAVKYYEPLGIALPHNPTSFRKLCQAYGELRTLEKAEANCWAVLQREGIRAYDHYNYLDLALQLVGASVPGVKERRTQMIEQSLERLRDLAVKTAEVKKAKEFERRDKLADEQLERIDAVEQRTALNTEPSLALQTELYTCQLGVQLADASRLQGCVENLRRVKAEPKIIAMFDWAWRTAANDAVGQKAALQQAKKHGLPEAALEAMINPKRVPVPPRLPITTLPEQPSVENAHQVRDALQAPVASETPTVQPASTRDVESLVAGIAALLGVGAAGWLLFKQLGSRVIAGRREPVNKQA